MYKWQHKVSDLNTTQLFVQNIIKYEKQDDFLKRVFFCRGCHQTRLKHQTLEQKYLRS